MSAQMEMLESEEPVRPLYIPNFGDTIETASKVFRISEPRIRKKVKAHKIYHQSAPNGTIRFELAALSMILSEDWKALALWRDGEAAHPAVIRHYQHTEKLVGAWLEGSRAAEKKARLAAE